MFKSLKKRKNEWSWKSYTEVLTRPTFTHVITYMSYTRPYRTKHQPPRPTKGPLERTNSFTIFHRRFLPSATLGCEKKQLCGSRHTIEEAMGDKQRSSKGRMKEVTIFLDKSKRKKTFRHPYVLRPRYVYIQTDAGILIKL